jgi:tetratricopeptide (TPR) repeat protein
VVGDLDNAVLHVGYGNVLKLLGRTTNEAEAEFQRGAELDSGYPDAWVNLAYLAQDKGDYATAIAHWERVLVG